jgi:hypothetical protein
MRVFVNILWKWNGLFEILKQLRTPLNSLHFNDLAFTEFKAVTFLFCFAALKIQTRGCPIIISASDTVWQTSRTLASSVPNRMVFWSTLPATYFTIIKSWTHKVNDIHVARGFHEFNVTFMFTFGNISNARSSALVASFRFSLH